MHHRRRSASREATSRDTHGGRSGVGWSSSRGCGYNGGVRRQLVKQADGRLAWPGRFAAGLVAVTLVLAAVATLAQVAAPVLGWRPVWQPVATEPTDLSAAAAAQEFLRLVADSHRNDDTAPLPCALVTDPGGLLNPCMDALNERWVELEPIEQIGTKLTVRTVTSLTADTAVVTDADIYPRPKTKISISLEYGRDGAGWKVRQLNERDLPR